MAIGEAGDVVELVARPINRNWTAAPEEASIAACAAVATLAAAVLAALTAFIATAVAAFAATTMAAFAVTAMTALAITALAVAAMTALAAFVTTVIVAAVAAVTMIVVVAVISALARGRRQRSRLVVDIGAALHQRIAEPNRTQRVEPRRTDDVRRTIIAERKVRLFVRRLTLGAASLRFAALQRGDDLRDRFQAARGKAPTPARRSARKRHSPDA